MDFNSVVIISNMSIRNNVAISILHIHSYTNDIKKTIHHTVNITLTEAKLFAIRRGINQIIQILKAFYIIVITNAIYLAKYIYIFDSKIYSY